MRKTLAAALLAAALIPTQAQALDNEELLALVAMPLAVAAVSEVTDVPMNDLIDVVSLMNDAAVPPAQFIEVVRYAPVALVVDTQEPAFPDFVRVQFDNGLRGTALVSSIEDRFHVYGVEGVDLDVTAPRVIDVGENFVPPLVRTRIAERKAHPHGGPPGQLKKQRGLKTGAEVVHDTLERTKIDTVVVTRNEPVRKIKEQKVKRVDDDRRDVKVAKPSKSKGRGSDDHPGQGHGGGQGKGKGKGKG
jgi:hypothetical protein